KAFVDGLPDGTFDVAILRAVLALGQSLGIKVLAEGVETRKQFEFLKEQGVDALQGYYFGKPMSEQTFSAWLKNRTEIAAPT
ncbi:MAG: EAL domain-containing protein, partial [Marinobacter sp.]|nr:EAL domain-containing protein [Marinobacter sp.]